MAKAKVSSKYQIVIPKQAREKAGIDQGDQIEVIAMEDGVYLAPQPENWTDYGKGLGKEVWEDIDPLDYIRKERNSWKKRGSLNKA